MFKLYFSIIMWVKNPNLKELWELKTYSGSCGKYFVYSIKLYVKVNFIKSAMLHSSPDSIYSRN